MANSPYPDLDSLGVADPEQLVKDWSGMAAEYNNSEPGAGSAGKRAARIETLTFCAGGLQLWLKAVRGQHLALLPHDVLNVIHAAMRLKHDDMQSLADLIDAAEHMKFGQS